MAFWLGFQHLVEDLLAPKLPGVGELSQQLLGKSNMGPGLLIEVGLVHLHQDGLVVLGLSLQACNLVHLHPGENIEELVPSTVLSSNP